MENRRKDERTPIALFATVHTDDFEYTCRAVDVSAGGIRVEFDGDEIAEGTEIGVDFELPDSDRTMLIKGTVVHSTGTHLGIEFGRVKASYRKAIEHFVKVYGPLS